MSTELQHPIVVGVDGTDQSSRAVRFAVQEAKRYGCGVFLVHAIHETAPLAPMLPLISIETLEEVGEKIVADARQLVRDIAEDDVPVATLVKPGTRAQVLCTAGENARMIVLGHRDRSLLGRVFTSATTTGVGARAHCPVVCIPSTWTAGHEFARVVVGLDGSAPSKDALALAFQAAADREAKLTVLHAWKLASGYDDIIASRVMVDDWLKHAGAQMDEIVAPWRELYPDVEVEIDLRHQYPAHALVGATEGADLIVVGRRGHGAPLGIYLGSIARTLIREARCPVEIAPHHRPEEASTDRRMTQEQDSPQA
ncbi:MAG: universal stress protein [Nocardioidaceae bacterium]